MQPQINIYPVRKKLPVRYNTEIGRIITRWALAEFVLREVAYLLLGLGPKEGRIAVREPRVDDYLTMILDLMLIYKIKTSAKTTSLRNLLRECESIRDRLAHGIWLKHEGSKLPVIQEVKGKYPPAPGAKSVKARIAPRASVIPIETLIQCTRNIKHCIAQIYKLKHEITLQQTTRPEESR